MRISTAQMYDSSISSYSQGYSDLNDTYEELSSGIRVETPADDPVGASRLLQLEQQQAELDLYSSNMDAASYSLTQQESTLDQMNNVLQRARTLAVEAGDGSLTDENRAAIAQELDQIEEELLSMMNSKDASGQYIFGGADSDVEPFVKNADGSYSYQGDQTALTLQVSSSMSLVVTDSGWSYFEDVPSVSRTTSELTSAPSSGQVAYVGQGQLTSEKQYTDFVSGAPYALELTSDSEYIIYSADDTTKTPLASGSYDYESQSSQLVSFRGVDFSLNFALDSSSELSASEQLTGHVFTLDVEPDSFSINGNGGSSAQITGATVSDTSATGAYKTTFPDDGIVIQFTDATNYTVYASPYEEGDRALSTGTLSGDTLTYAGVTFTLSGTPEAGDSFTITSSSANSINILESISQLSDALKNTSSDDVASQFELSEAVAIGISSIDNAIGRVDELRASIGASLSTIDTLSLENQSLSINNANTQSSIRDADMSETASRLTLQQTKLEAAQAAFARISELSLFDVL